MDTTLVASILVSVISGTVAWATSRASSKASRFDTATTSRVDMEKEAYDRARKYDVDTIDRQEEEIKELRDRVKAYEAEVKILNERIARLERNLPLPPEENTNG